MKINGKKFGGEVRVRERESKKMRAGVTAGV
jgi:hypothetical protein